MLSAGIVGLPNVGKSTLFNAVTRTRNAQAANYPFCTIEPNQGVVTVPDPRLETLAKMSKSVRKVPAAIEFVDIAGLVAGASQGEGLGNQFLSHIREVDAIVQVVRCFESGDIHHVSGSVDAIRDIEVVNTELILADLASLQKRFDRLQKQVRTGDKQAKAESALLATLIPHLNSGKPAITLEVSPEEKLLMRSFFLLTVKPTIFACNVSESDLGALSAGETDTAAARHVAAVSSYVHTHLATEAVVISAEIESELVDLSPAEAAEYLYRSIIHACRDGEVKLAHGIAQEFAGCRVETQVLRYFVELGLSDLERIKSFLLGGRCICAFFPLRANFRC